MHDIKNALISRIFDIKSMSVNNLRKGYINP